MAGYNVSKEVEAYVRSLSSLCRNDKLAYYFTLYNFSKIQEGFLNKKSFKKELSKIGIVDYPTFKYRLDWLRDEGWRVEFSKMHSFLSTLTEIDRKHYVESFPKEHKDFIRLSIVHYYIDKLPIGGIAAFDLAWHIYLCRAGKVLGYLTDAETWKLALEAARQIQSLYSNWNEFVTAFVCGSQFKEEDESFSFVQKNQEYINKLFASPNSPMVNIDWGIDLK